MTARFTPQQLAERPWLVHYTEGVPADIEPPTQSVVGLLDDATERFPDHVALDFFGATTTYAELRAQVLQASAALHDLGVTKGDRVAIILPNCPQHVVAFYAVLRIGAIVVEHNPLYTQHELHQQLTDHEPRAVIAWDVVAPLARASVPERTPVIAVDMTTALPLAKRLALRLPIAKARKTRAAMTATAGELPRWHELVRGHAPLPPSVPGPDVADIALLQYTGGTTGVPKGAILTHANLVSNARQSAAWAADLIPGEETFYAVLPLFHAYGLTLCLTTAVLLGARVALFPRFDVDLVLDAMRRCPATFLPGVPPMYPRLVEAAKSRGVSLGSVRVALAGAMSLSPDIVEQWESFAGGLLIEGYGMTETSPIALGNPIAPTRRPNSIGVPFPSTEMRVADRDQPDRIVEHGEPGELQVRGPQVFAGYWNRPDETANVLLADGWLRTGDVVTVDDDDFVTVVDRIKELILVGGFNVYPSEVETALAQLPGVAEVAVIAMPTPNGDEVVAVVVPEAGAAIDEADLLHHARESLAGYKVPRRIVFVEELPRSLIGKLLRRQVRDDLIARDSSD